MPLLEIIQVRRATASIHLEESTAALIDQYAAFLGASADEVVDKALSYVFAKDREFQEFLRTPAARDVPASLRIRMVPQSGAAPSDRTNGAAKPVAAVQEARDARPRS